MFYTNIFLSLALVASSVYAAPHDGPHGNGNGSSSSSGAYELIADYSGPGFFDNFNTYTGEDPTHGHVVYQDLKSAAQQQLVGYVYNSATKKSSAYIGVDHTNVAPNGRNSVRLESKQTFNAGSMVVIDTNHIPVGDGLWPAIWLLGTKGTWPASGESDILEYVHETTYNGMTLHTAPGCDVQPMPQQYQGKILNTSCNAGNAATGCSIAATNQNTIAGTQNRIATAGYNLNKQGGGVYVHDWQPDGITVWMFEHGRLPADLASGKPNPSTWKQKPLAKFQGGCDFSKSFYDMQLIINIDFCGDWAGKVWEEHTDGDESKKSPRNRTGVATCNDYVANNPQAFKDAYFDISSVKFYTSNGQKPGLDSPAGYKRHEHPILPPRHRHHKKSPPQPPFPSSNNRDVEERGLFERLTPTPQTQTSNAEVEVKGWLAAAGMCALIAFWF